MELEGHKQHDQCSLFGGLNLALHYPPSHKLGLSESFIKIRDRPVITAAVKKKGLFWLFGRHEITW